MNRLLKLVMPALAAIRVKVVCPSRSLADWRDLLSPSTDLSDVALRLFDTDLARIRRLEDKLSGQMAFLAPLVPIFTTLGAVALHKGRFWAAILMVLAGLNMLVAYLIAHTGFAAVKLSMPFPIHVAEELTRDPTGSGVALDLAARTLWATEQNEAVAIKLNNLIWAGGRSLQNSIVLVLCAAFFAF